MLANQEQNTSSLCVRHCSKMCVSNFKFKPTAKKRVENLPSSINQKIRLNRSKIAEKLILQNFKRGPSLWKCLGFQSNLSTYKRETLATFFRLLGRHMRYSLWNLRDFVPSNYTSVYQSKIYNQAMVEPSCYYKDQQLRVIRNLWVGSQSHKRGCLCSSKSKERKSLWIRRLHMVMSVSYYLR